MKTVIIFAVSLILSGCATRPESPAPIVDTKAMSSEKLSTFYKDERECRAIQVKAMPFSFLDAFGTSDVKAYERDREVKASTIMRECLKGRGHSVIY